MFRRMHAANNCNAQEATGVDARAARAQFMSHCYRMLLIKYVFESHYLSDHYDQISPYCVILGHIH